jgi:glycine/D-amino acid oxidase-like deaminating enzyme
MKTSFDRIDPKMTGVHWVATSKEIAFEAKKEGLQDTYDLAVVGGGYCGLSISLEAARLGLSVILLEAGTIGCGASGRNGGIVVPTLPGARTPSYLEERLGKHRATNLIELVRTGPDFVFDRIRDHHIACDANKAGWVQPAHTEKTLGLARKVHDEWLTRGANVTWLDAGGIRERLGAPGYLGGWFSESGGTLNPWALAQGLARIASAAGVHIVEGAAVQSLVKDGSKKLIRTPNGEFTARQVVITTNGYTPDLVPRLSDTVIPVRLFHCLTRPLFEMERADILPKGTPFTDLRKSGGFCRFDAEGRLMSGGAVFTARNASLHGQRHAAQRLAEIFPQLTKIKIDHYWEGWCAIREEFLPVSQDHGDGVYSLLGFSTRGIALAQTLGREMARFLAGTISEERMPIPVRRLSPIPLRAVKQTLGGWAFPVYKLRDRLER